MKKVYTKELLEPIVKESETFSEVLRKIDSNRTIYGGAVDYLKKRMIELGIDFSHFVGRRWMRGKKSRNGLRANKDRFIELYINDNSKIITHRLKRRLIGFNLKSSICEICGNVGEWNGQALTLQLDHINGIKTDNRLENLRILCPNCHSQTDTYSGKKNGK
jgi:5-methylcytosine-specific restriction endonuclease McrA